MTIWSIKQIQNGARQFEVVTVDGRMYSRDILEWFLDLLARSIPVDEGFYRTSNPDVDAAIAKGEVMSGAAHFIEHGFYEDRCPLDVQLDEGDYLERYPDIAEAAKRGEVVSPTAHWLMYGRFEGRRAMLQLAHNDGPEGTIQPVAPKQQSKSQRLPKAAMKS